MICLDKEGCVEIRKALGITTTQAAELLHLKKSQLHNIEEGTPAIHSLIYYTLMLNHLFDTCGDLVKKKKVQGVLAQQELRLIGEDDVIIF